LGADLLRRVRRPTAEAGAGQDHRSVRVLASSSLLSGVSFKSVGGVV
jgi:hypothetical protein